MRYDVHLDGRLLARVPAVRRFGPVAATNDLELELGRLAPGEHRVALTGVDRAGNRSPRAESSFTR